MIYTSEESRKARRPKQSDINNKRDNIHTHNSGEKMTMSVWNFRQFLNDNHSARI